MKVFIGADHRGFLLKNKLIEYLQKKNIRVEDMGNYTYDNDDDYPDFSKPVAQAVKENSDSYGILVCGSGVGVSIAANRVPGIRAALGFNVEQIIHARMNDHINIVSLPSDYLETKQAEELVDVFLTTPIKESEKYQRRITKLDE